MSIFSFGVLSLAPVMGLGLTSAREARDRQLSAQIAETLTDQAREGALPAGTSTFDDQGETCAAASARFQSTATETTLPGNCIRVLIKITPVNAPNRPVVYAVVLPNI